MNRKFFEFFLWRAKDWEAIIRNLLWHWYFIMKNFLLHAHFIHSFFFHNFFLPFLCVFFVLCCSILLVIRQTRTLIIKSCKKSCQRFCYFHFRFYIINFNVHYIQEKTFLCIYLAVYSWDKFYVRQPFRCHSSCELN